MDIYTQPADFENYMYLSWVITDFCNYRCSYCKEEHYGGKHKWVEHKYNEKFLRDVRARNPHKKIFLEIFGGEPTLYPKLIELLEVCKELNIYAELISNAAKRLSYWERIAPLLNHVSLSYHIENTNYDHFKDVAKLCAEYIDVYTTFVPPPDYVKDAYFKAIDIVNTETTKCLMANIKPVRINFGAHFYPYSDEEWRIFRNCTLMKNKNRTTEHISKSSDLYHTTDTGVEVLNLNKFLASGKTVFTGYRCNAGIDKLRIDPNGDIHAADCRVLQNLGNTQTTWAAPTEPPICNRLRCTCRTDLALRKERIDE